MKEPLEIGKESVPSGQLRRIQLPVARLPTHTMLSLPVTAINGARDGARLWLSAAIHGDELNGMEIIRRVLKRIGPRTLAGALIAVPIVNVFGFIQQSRYMPDRRDLNRSFPGSKKGSLAARLAHLFMTEVVARSDHGIDLHTAAPPRVNLPQIRCDLENAETRRCAQAFAAPAMCHGSAPKGSLRSVAARKGIPVLLYEAGEPLRFNDQAIEVGVDGILRMMAELEMIPRKGLPEPGNTVEINRSSWVRAPQSGVLYLRVKLGDRVEKKQVLGEVRDPLGGSAKKIKAPFRGLVIGLSNNPLAHRGDAIINLGALPE